MISNTRIIHGHDWRRHDVGARSGDTGAGGWGDRLLFDSLPQIIHWLRPEETYRKIGFIISLGTILGAAIVDITIILTQALRRFKEQANVKVKAGEDWKKVNTFQLVLWVVFWAGAIIFVGNQLLGQPVLFLAIAIGLAFIFMLVNGISQGISDWNPISSAFVLTVFILVACRLTDPIVGLLSAAIVFVGVSVGGDMQQDRSTGWRLGTNRVVQFRYQVIGIAMGAILSIALAKLFMNAFDVLRWPDSSNNNVPGAEKWQSAMTLKLVGALRGITNPKPQVMKALWLGISIGLFIQLTRTWIKRIPSYKNFIKTRTGHALDFFIDAVLLCSPYASSFGGFVELNAVYWWAAGGIAATLF